MKNNARVGSDIAIALSRLRKDGGQGKSEEKRVAEKPRNSVINKQQQEGKKTGQKDVVIYIHAVS